MHPSHVTPDPKNTRADRTLSLARIIRDRCGYGLTEAEVRADLVPEYADEETFFLALAAARVLAD